MRTLNYHHLRLFQAVAREGNLPRASKQLHLTLQTVSTQIRDLEAALGEQLFQRSGRRMFLTDAEQMGETNALSVRLGTRHNRLVEGAER